MKIKNYGLSKLSNEELKKISLEKNDLGVATEMALKAQEILWYRAGKPFYSGTNNTTFNNSSFEDDDFGFGNMATDLYDKYIDSKKHM